MKLTLFLLSLIIGLSGSIASAQMSCSDEAQTIQGGVDILPWSVAKPFPWDNIQGYWKLGDDSSSYVRAKVLSTTTNRKFLSLQVYGEGYCSKPYAKGTGYVDITEKNVVRAILFDNQYRYQMKLGLFDSKDIVFKGGDLCSGKVMAVSMQVVGRSTKNNDMNFKPLDPRVTETRNMLLKKVTVDPDLDCR